MRWLALLGFAACLPAAGLRHPECDRHSDLCAARLDEIECEHAREFCPQAPEPLVNLGMISQSRGQNERAREYYVQALRRDVECAVAYNNLGTVELAERSFKAAAQRFERALKVNPDYNEARHNLGLAHWRMGRLEDAEKDFRHMIAANPALAQPYGSLGGLELERGRYDVAARWLEQAVLLEPQWAEAWRGLAAAREGLGLRADAASAFESCLDVGGDDSMCREGLRRNR
ncbi:MAG: tetratricopeptide repeat protein [Archangiaceae bacterium]|nr:tetratricopeptide repeat protein [Archangiaceae bacterium]